METYPKLTYHVSRFQNLSSSEFAEIIKKISNDLGHAIFNYWLNDDDIDAIILEKNKTESQFIDALWVKEAVKEYQHRAFEKQFR